MRRRTWVDTLERLSSAVRAMLEKSTLLDSDEKAGLPLTARSRRRWRPRFNRAGWAAAMLSRERWVARVTTLLWVLPLTGLIWIYAERAQIDVTTGKGLVVPVTVVSGDPTRFVSLLSPTESKLMVDLEGPRATLEMVKKQLGAGLTVEVDHTLPPGEHRLGALAQVRDQPLFRSRGIRVSGVQPDSLQVKVDEIGEEMVEVRIPEGIENLEQTTAFEPRQVKVSGPKEVLRRLRQDGLKVTADIARLPELKKAGAHEVMDVPVNLPLADQNLTVSPSTVKAILKVKEEEKDGTIPSVPIWTEWPDHMQGRYKVVYESDRASIPNVVVKGPPAQIDALNSEDPARRPSYRAMLRVDPGDLPDAPITRRVRFEFAPNVIHVPPGAPEYSVSFRLVELTGAP